MIQKLGKQYKFISRVILVLHGNFPGHFLGIIREVFPRNAKRVICMPNNITAWYRKRLVAGGR